MRPEIQRVIDQSFIISQFPDSYNSEKNPRGLKRLKTSRSIVKVFSIICFSFLYNLIQAHQLYRIFINLIKK